MIDRSDLPPPVGGIEGGGRNDNVLLAWAFWIPEKNISIARPQRGTLELSPKAFYENV
jgi:hypothetical protein